MLFELFSHVDVDRHCSIPPVLLPVRGATIGIAEGFVKNGCVVKAIKRAEALRLRSSQRLWIATSSAPGVARGDDKHPIGETVRQGLGLNATGGCCGTQQSPAIYA